MNASPDKFRNILAFFLVGSFVTMLPALIVWAIPAANKDIVTYMVGQLSGMAATVLGFYFVNKAGQDALDQQKADNTGKALDAITATAQAGNTPTAILQPGQTAQAAQEPVGN